MLLKRGGKYKKSIYDCHEPIISRELWETANRIHLERKHYHYKDTKKNIYHGLLYCAHCGKALRINSVKVTSCFCNCWPIIAKPSSRCMNIDTVSRRLVSDIHGLANACEEDENSAFNLIIAYLANMKSTEPADIHAELHEIQSHIDTLNQKISILDTYSQQQTFSSSNSNTILAALETSLSAETAKLEHLKKAHHALASDEDIWNFIKAARRFGYLKTIDLDVLEELIDKVYISKKENTSRLQQQRITIKFKYIGVISTNPLTRNGVLIRPNIGTRNKKSRYKN